MNLESPPLLPPTPLQNSYSSLILEFKIMLQHFMRTILNMWPMNSRIYFIVKL